jgi:hypothetical protein
MRVNPRQEELIHELVRAVQVKFPSMKYKGFHASPHGESQIWIEVDMPDEETMLDMSEFAAVLETQILVDYGYNISLIPSYPAAQALETA